ncbi:RNA polymerase sigma factor [Ferruginibacter sp.]
MKSTTTLTDQEAVQAFINGDSNGLELLVERHKNRIYTSIYLLVKDKYVAEDIFQDVFIKIIEKLKSGGYNEENKFVQWAMRIAHNLCIDHFRRAKTRPAIATIEGRDVFEVLQFEEGNAEENIMKRQSHSTVMQMLALLPKEQQEVIILRHFANLRFKEIADILTCSVNTALGRMRYALLNLRKMMEEKQLAL